jgi:hypothetical protein
MCVAGESGDRRSGCRKAAGREESPDTIVVGSQELVTNDPSGALCAFRANGQRAR